MAIEKIIDIVVNEVGVDSAVTSIGKLENEIQSLEKTQNPLSGSMKESSLSILDNGGAMGILNDLTGGYAMTVKDAVEASGLFSKGTAIQTGLQKAYAMVVGTSTGALKGLKLALATSGIGAFVILLGYLVSKFMDATEATEAEVKAQEDLAKAIAKTTEMLNRQNKELEVSANFRKARAEIAGASEKELLKIETEASDERIAALHAERDALLELQNDKNLTVEQAQEINKKLLANNDAVIKELNGQELSRLAFQKTQADERREAEKEAQEKAAEDAKKRYEDRLAKEREYQKQLADELFAFRLIQEQVNQQQFDSDFAALLEKEELLRSFRTENAERKLEEEYENSSRTLEAAAATQEEFLELDQYYEGLRNEIKAEREEAKIEEMNLAIENQALEFETRFAVLEEQRNMILEAEKITEEERTALLAANTEARIKLGKEEVDAKLKMGAAIAQGLSTASKLAGESTSAGKALAVASATIDTIQGGISAFTGMVQSIPGPVGIALGAVAAAGVVASGYASVKKILAVKVPGNGGGGGAGAAPTPPPAPPQFNVVGQSGTNQLAESIGKKQDRPVEAYVVAGNVTTQQELDRNKVNTATFNGGG